MGETETGGRLGVRARTTLVTVVVVSVVLAAGAVAFLAVTENRIEASLRTRATARAEALAAVVSAGALTDPLPGADPELVAQVVDRDGTVIASDPSVAGSPPMAALQPEVGERRGATLDALGSPNPIGDDPPFAVVALGVEVGGRPGAVLVAVSLDDAADLVSAAAPVLGLGLPAILAVVALATWILTGRALRPVERMREEAEQISAAALDRRLPVPGSADEVQRLATTLNAMLERLDASAAEQRRFVADAAHELRSPLAVLRSMADAAQPQAGPGTPPELARDLLDEVVRMEALVDDLLSLARYDEGPAVRRIEVDLDQTVRAVVAETLRDGRLRVDTSGVEAVRVAGDPGALQRIVRNLADNAVRHTDGGVWITLVEHDGDAVLTVDDDGPGIPDADRDRVFERFARLDDARSRATGGTGLGLAVVRAAARAHGGAARVVEPRRGGASLEVRLPLGG